MKYVNWREKRLEKFKRYKSKLQRGMFQEFDDHPD